MTSEQLINELKTLADPKKAEHSHRFFKSGKGEYAEGDQFLGIRVPAQRVVARKYKALPFDEIEPLMHHAYHEVRLTAVLLLTYKRNKKNSDDVARFYLNNLEGVNNWDLVDSSCYKILGPWMAEDPDRRQILYEFAQSDDLWKKRIAMVTCIHFISNNDFEDTLNLAEILVNDSHDLIHKAVGWMLREMGKRDLKTETDFLDKHAGHMPRTMLRYAIEKFEEPLRQHYLNF